ncbi:MAG TPA: SUMF1/EgtB/PvdO family nonheme iron enzyme [Anaerolineales bacterium]|nr:SUMF1/EgtB/PvdO family nonheme iron enzyme [Anaerolineales bacterium]
MIEKSDILTLSNGMEFMRIPAGKFLMGSNDSVFRDENPQHTVDIPYDYWMARFPVTNAQYNQFQERAFDKGKENHPVVRVIWRGAMIYCQALNQLLKAELPSSTVVRLPTEAEWEKAARGTDGREYPWGDQFDKNKCNTSESEKKDTTPVGLYSPQGDSPYGCADMAGNVWEWTHSQLRPYPYNVHDGREHEITHSVCVLRGGSFETTGRLVRCTYRHNFYIFDSFNLDNIGFRVCIAPPLPK